MYNTGLLPSTPLRLGESKFWRWVLSSWTLHTYLALSIAFSACLILILDGTQLLPGESKRSTDLWDASLTVGEVTTLVSASLVIIRTLGQAWIMTATWRCAMILLQHDGLSLGQLDNMISYRIPTTYSGRHSIKIALVMLMMFPSTYIAPLASGSIDWRSTHVYDDVSLPVDGGFGRDIADWFFYWHQWRDIQSAVAFGALGRAFQSWDFGSGHPISPEGTYRYIARGEAKPATKVENVPMPFIKVHSITWDDNWPAWAESIVFDQRKIRYSGGADRQTNTLGSGMVFDNNTTLPNSLPNSTTAFEARKKVAMLAGRSQHIMFRNNCTAASAYSWDGMENITLKAEKDHYNCYALGTIHFTAGIMYFPIGTYLNNQTVEARLDSRVDSMTKGRLIGDP